MPQTAIAFQDYYTDSTAHCYGCGRLNDQGYRIKTFWEGEETVTRFTPSPHHTAIPGYVYGGLLASLIDCHGTGSAAAAAALADGYRLGEGEVPQGMQAPRFVTASLHVDYRKPTPLGPELVIRGRFEEDPRSLDGPPRKVAVVVRIEADGVVTVEGRVVAVRMPDSFL